MGWGDKKKELLIEEKIKDWRNSSICLIIYLQNVPKSGTEGLLSCPQINKQTHTKRDNQAFFSKLGQKKKFYVKEAVKEEIF